jgi:hypothetical protein
VLALHNPMVFYTEIFASNDKLSQFPTVMEKGQGEKEASLQLFTIFILP